MAKKNSKNRFSEAAEAVATGRPVRGLPKDYAERSTKGFLNALANEIRKGGPVKGLRDYPVASIPSLLAAYDAFKELPEDQRDAEAFSEAWSKYVQGLDFPCEQNANGMHQGDPEKDGACALCGTARPEVPTIK